MIPPNGIFYLLYTEKFYRFNSNKHLEKFFVHNIVFIRLLIHELYRKKLKRKRKSNFYWLFQPIQCTSQKKRQIKSMESLVLSKVSSFLRYSDRILHLQGTNSFSNSTEKCSTCLCVFTNCLSLIWIVSLLSRKRSITIKESMTLLVMSWSMVLLLPLPSFYSKVLPKSFISFYLISWYLLFIGKFFYHSVSWLSGTLK